MELFLSYSRHDSDMGDRLRADLEAAGHHVWLDRDDIRGGEQWRASIAKGIAAADRVLLLSSPASLQSENVAREISIADDLDKPILPLVLEASEVPAEFQFLLAGVQTIDFDGQSYQSALSELLGDLERPSGPSQGLTTIDEPRARNGRRWLVAASFLIVAFGLAAIWPNQTPDESTTTNVSAEATSTASVATTTAGIQTLPLGGSAWLAGVQFSPRDAIHDHAQSEVTVDYQVEVRQTETRSWVDLFPSMLMLPASGGSLFPFSDSGAVPGLGTSSVEIAYCCPAADVDLSTATLVFGLPTQQSWTLPMRADAVGSGVAPVHVDVADRVEADGLYFDVSGIDLVPWACEWNSDGHEARRGETVFGPVSNDRLTVVLTGTLGSGETPSGFVQLGQVSLIQPNGNQAALLGSFSGYQPNEFATQVPLCFLVETPGTGTYRLNWASAVGGQDTFEFTIG